MSKRWVTLCLFSAVLGALLHAALTAPVPTNLSRAQAATEAPAVAAGPRPTPLPPVDPVASNRGADELTAEEKVNVAVYEQVNRGVVNINTKSVHNGLFLLETESTGGGSGSILDRLGHVLTNQHVIDGAREVEVTLFNGKNYEATVIGKDEASDVAVLKIDAPADSLFPVTFGDSQALKVGQRVFAIGNPFGLERTLTTGIISSLDRTLPTRDQHRIKSVIQIDAAINPGNSGGPLLDSHSRLIGMNTAIASSTGQSSGVGFAIPVANIARVVPQLIEHGRVIRSDAGIVRVLQLEQGLLIATMTPNGPAEKAGLRGFRVTRQKHRQGPFTYETQTVDRNSDLIVAVDGAPIKSAGDFLGFVEAKKPGDEIILTVIREGRELKIPLRLTASES